ncbi:MAG: lysylphosphatidylglycerol synthase domain-containing protein [Candidatus Micrarchaeia archaeon]
MVSESDAKSMRNKALSALAYLFVLGAIAYAVIKFLGGENYLVGADWPMLGLALLAYLASIFFWSLAWAKSAGIQRKEAALLTFAAAAGALTPMGVGSDALRGYFSRRDAAGMSHIVLSSFATKLHKIVFSAVAAGAFLVLYGAGLSSEILYASMAGIAVSIVSVVLLYFFLGRLAWVEKFLPRKLLPEYVHKGSKDFRRMLATLSKESVLLIAVSLAFELVAFYSCFLAFNVDPGIVLAAGAFAVTFFASKIPFLHGFGLIEMVGVFLLQGAYPVPLLVAVFFCFDVARLWFPTLVSAGFVALLTRRSK